MAKDKKEQKFFDCETCSEMDKHQDTKFCTLRNNSDSAPQLMSICAYIERCDWYKENRK